MTLKSEMTLRPLEAGDLAEAAALLARGMRDNPTHVEIFGTDPERRTRRLTTFFSRALPGLFQRGTILGAFRADRLVGVLAMVEPGRCQSSRLESLRMLPAFLYGAGPRVAMRMNRLMTAWARRDLKEPHWHLGPAAIDPNSRGVGRFLLPGVCHWLDQREAPAYLETEQSRNVRLYQHFGFQVIGEDTVHGVPCWFMLRAPRV